MSIFDPLAVTEGRFTYRRPTISAVEETSRGTIYRIMSGSDSGKRFLGEKKLNEFLLNDFKKQERDFKKLMQKFKRNVR
tara:strand:+ start:528 stop:764 length:237 start_codon:yes stop_codon:yes gene_type:complete